MNAYSLEVQGALGFWMSDNSLMLTVKPLSPFKDVEKHGLKFKHQTHIYFMSLIVTENRQKMQNVLKPHECQLLSCSGKSIYKNPRERSAKTSLPLWETKKITVYEQNMKTLRKKNGTDTPLPRCQN